MINIKNISATDQYGMDFIYITFSIDDYPDDIALYKYNIYRSDNSTNSFTMIAENIATFNYMDTTANLYDVSLDYFYKIEVVNTVTSEKNMSEMFAEYKGRQYDSQAFALINIYNTYLDAVVDNQPIAYLKRKHYGQICSCYDDVRNRSKVMDCPICYGTHYVGGYDPQEIIKMSFANSSAKIERFEISDVAEDDNGLQGWTSNFPELQVNDILVDSFNDRYIITGWQPTYKNQYLIRQTVQMQRVPKSNIIYEIPISL